MDGGNLNTEEALKLAAIFEHHEWAKMYAKFAEVAKEEGSLELAKEFEGVAKIERYHEQRFRELLQNVETDHVFKKDQPVVWICRNCGNHVYGEEAPDHCPVCGYPQSYFQLPCHNY